MGREEQLVQTRSTFKEDDSVDNFVTMFYHMQLFISRHGENLSLVNVVFASVTSKEASLLQIFTRKGTKDARLTALKVKTQAYLADNLLAKAPHLECQEKDNTEDLAILN